MKRTFRATRRMFHTKGGKKRIERERKKEREGENEKATVREKPRAKREQRRRRSFFKMKKKKKGEKKIREPQNFFRDFYFTMSVIMCECACVE